jgi:hypothetical protein
MSLLPTTILMLSANPKGTVPLRLDEERREIESGLIERSRLRDTFRLITKTAVRPRDFQRAMLDLNPQIVHFSGHGEAEPGLAREFCQQALTLALETGIPLAQDCQILRERLEKALSNSDDSTTPKPQS